MDRFRGFASILVALLLGCFSPWIHGKLVPDNFDQKLVALFKVIDYVHRRPHQMNADATFGITMAEANIASMLMHKNSGYLGSEYLNILNVILKLCDSTRRYLISKVVSKNENVQLLQETLNSPALWMGRISWKNNSLRTQPSPTPGLTYRVVFNLIMQGTPKEEESDRCLADIIRHRLHGKCRVPETCEKIFSKKDRSRGYPLTHKMLILKVMKALECEGHKHEHFAGLIHSYCSAILQDLIDIETKGFPYNTRDLMMEQVVLCGMEGYLEFTGKHNEDLILSWAHSSGCFSSFGFQKNRSVVRRSSLKTDFGCDSHATGLAAASLALLIRENVENAF